jgi:putative phage-type endonuclease
VVVVTLHTYDEVEQGSEEWHALRRGIVTASTVGRLLTTKTIQPASNDDSRALTALLVAERITGWTDPTYVNADMWRGVECEPIARDIYSGHYQQAVECGFMRRDEDGWTLGYSPDGLVADDGLVEIKAPRAKTHLNTILSGGVPDLYMPQLQAGLLVSGRKWIDFVSFCGGMPLYVQRVLPSPNWFEAIETAVRKFETTAAEMVAAYEKATQGLPATERVVELEMSL